ncbi:MAG: L-threonylcarbamoyladenylate synthase [Crocinitomicaceae bacterium]|nr:L-threonylcarbamoyladenylate synthase [Crocinitomicaceae bacterium]
MKEAIDTLRDGGTILYPSDTIWGIGCDATNEVACQKLLEIKKRPENKSFILLVDGFPMLERYIPEFQEVCYDLVDFASKPLTIIYPNAEGLAPSVIAEDGSVGIRITTDPICLKLIRGMRKPLVSTSANVSDDPSPKCYDDVAASIKNDVDSIVMERTKEKMQTPSQIINVGISGDVKIIRE